MNKSPAYQNQSYYSRRNHHILGVDGDDGEEEEEESMLLSTSTKYTNSPFRKSPSAFSTITTGSTSPSTFSSPRLIGESPSPTMEISDDRHSPLQNVYQKKTFQQQYQQHYQQRNPPAIISPDRHHHGGFSDNNAPIPAATMSSSPPRAVSPTSSSAPSPSSDLSYFYASRVVALDCEMVGVGPKGQRSVLARVSVVDFFGNCLLDTFVRVQERVTDYRTHITGIEPHHLSSPEAMPFGVCRNIVRDLTRNRILVGHGLSNDMKVLGLDHPWYCTRDTAFYKPYMRVDQYGRHSPRRLRDLARYHLGMVIQKQGISHNSMEDACAAMLLYRHVQSQWDCEMDHRRRNVVMKARSCVDMMSPRF